MTEKDAKSTRNPNTVQLQWAVPFAKIIASPADWTKLRAAIAVVAILTAQEVGPGSATKREPDKNLDEINMRGVALLGGKLYLSSRASHAILIFDSQTAKPGGEIKLEKPGPIAVSGNSLIALSGSRVVRIEPATGKVTVLFESKDLDVQGLATDKAGQIYLSDGKTHTVRVFDASGKALRILGTPGGAYVGAYDEKRMVNPRGLVVAPNGWLWVTEWRERPKRYAAYDSQTGALQHDYWGRTAYGAPGAGMDSQDHSRWVGMDALWKLDYKEKTARPTSLLGAFAADINATHHRFVHQDGRTFLISMGAVTFISEIQKDGSAKNLALCGTVSGYTHGFRRALPPAFAEAFERQSLTMPKSKRNGISALWVDKSGDGQMQPDEFEFSHSADSFAGAYWGNDMRDLTLRFPAVVGGKNVLVALTPQGFYPRGAPKYPDFQTAIAAAVPMEKPDVVKFQPRVETTVDGRGNLIFNSDPKMTAFAPDGKLLWTYPNRWSNVHGSHNAPLPQTGELQGALFFTGIAPLDKESDVFALNGNHGRMFLMTSDGLYLDEMFEDGRLGRNRMEVELKHLSAGGPHTLTITGDNVVTIRNVLVGEVWVCSGQSNMARILVPPDSVQPRQSHWTEEAAAANYSQIRHFRVGGRPEDAPATESIGEWEICSPETAPNFTAVGYFFARDLLRARKVPVGIISASVGGTGAATWTSRESLKSDPKLRGIIERQERSVKEYPARLEQFRAGEAKSTEEYNAALKKAQKENSPLPRKPEPPRNPMTGNDRPSSLYNGKIAPLQPFSIRGVLWYQGESDAGNARRYGTLFPALISGWRKAWGQGDFPFLFIQLAPYKNTGPEIREAQLQTWISTPNTAMVVTTNAADGTDVHPPDKRPVGSRLALVARGLVYNEKIEYSGPLFDTAKVEGNRAILSFKHVGSGLKAKDAELRGFTIAGPDKKFLSAKAEIQGQLIVLSNDQIVVPSAVRYGWANVPDGNLFNQEGLPASPFRTDAH